MNYLSLVKNKYLWLFCMCNNFKGYMQKIRLLEFCLYQFKINLIGRIRFFIQVGFLRYFFFILGDLIIYLVDYIYGNFFFGIFRLEVVVFFNKINLDLIIILEFFRVMVLNFIRLIFGYLCYFNIFVFFFKVKKVKFKFLYSKLKE